MGKLQGSLEQVTMSIVTFSTNPPWITDQPDQCLTATDDRLELSNCTGGADQNLELYNYHFLQYNGKCLQGNSTWAGFVTCDRDDPSQWYQLAQVGVNGPIANCWCTGQTDCRKPCNGGAVPGVVNSSSDAFMVIDNDPLWFFMKYPTTTTTSNSWSILAFLYAVLAVYFSHLMVVSLILL